MSKLLKESKVVIEKMLDSLQNLPVLEVSSLPKEDSAVVVIDMIDGFSKSGGTLYSERIEGIIPYLVEKLGLFAGYQKIFFADAHTEDAPEFSAYPPHCLDGTQESELISELTPFLSDSGLLFKKNSTNGFLSPDFATWFSKYSKVKNYVIFGDCTDICVLQFALTLKAYFNQWNIVSNVIVPIQGVATYDLEATNHHAELMGLFALYNLQLNGIALVKDVQ